MQVHNTRSPEQWKIISKQIDFKGKTVLDLGCGKGDILIRAFDAGAKMATGIDNGKENISHIRNARPGIVAIEENIDYLDVWWAGPKKDVIICFSVLPYLTFPESILRWINRHSDIALIECQYAGDGPGYGFLTGNDAMDDWLMAYGKFENVGTIGHTLVEGRNKKRYIWMCI